MAVPTIKNNSSAHKGFVLWQLGFRPFFLLALLAAVVLIFYWIYQFFYRGTPSVYPPLNWHSHEMIFGYTVAVITGFLLTAEKNWTGVQTLNGAWLALLACVWLAGRLMPWLTPLGLSVPYWLVAAVDLVFLPVLAVALLTPLLKTAQYNHIVFIIILGIFLIGNLLFHGGVSVSKQAITQAGIQLAWLVVLYLIVIMGGRVIPFFIERGTGQRGSIRSSRVVEIGSYSSLLIWMIMQFDLSYRYTAGTVAVIAMGFQLIRLYQWHVTELWRHPMLWILYLGYAWLPVGLLLSAYAAFTGMGTTTVALHAFTAGTIGLMTIGMMARVSLGHTGREMRASPFIVVAFCLVILGSLVRVIGAFTQFELISKHYALIVSSAGVLWALGFLVLLIILVPVLLRARVDGRPG
jgi:uncharacterized protein involved in response to NO